MTIINRLPLLADGSESRCLCIIITCTVRSMLRWGHSNQVANVIQYNFLL